MLALNNTDPDPLYRQLYKQIRERVLSGKYSANSRLPSVRELAVELSTSRNTVEGAYQELYAEGYIYSMPRSGYFVSALDQDATPLARIPKSYTPLTNNDSPPDYLYDFHPARLDPASFSVPLWRKLILESLRENQKQFVQYCNPQGETELRATIRLYLESSRGVICDPEQIVICSGLQHSLDIVLHILKDKHSSVAVENPGYHLPRSVFRNHSFEIIPVPVGASGLDLDALKSGNSTIAYVTPSHQLPMGWVMPVANRLKLIEWAESGGKFIIEDDYDSELRYHGKPIPSLQGLRPSGNIIYLGSFSKILSPALRVSYLVLPQMLLDRYRQLFQDYFPTVPLLEQKALVKFMEQGHWNRHIRRMRTVYKTKHDALLRAVERYFGNNAVVVGQGAGLHVVLQLHGSKLDETEIIDQALQNGIRLFRFSDFYVTGKPDKTRLVLGFGGMTTSDIDQGITLLSKICF